MNKGLIIDEIKPEDYVLGGSSLPLEVLAPDGDWSSFLPLWEAQKKGGVETMSCATFATLNAIEAILARKFGVITNKSDRYNAVMSGTTRQGNSPHRVIESIRKVAGTIPEAMHPFGGSTWDEYHASELITPLMKKVGQEWLGEYEIYHEWVFSGGDEEEKCMAIMDALHYSPVGVSVHAWNTPKNGLYYKEEGQVDNHWVLAFRAVEGEYIEVYDQYEKQKKKIAWGTDFLMAKRYYMKKKSPQKLSIFARIIDIIKSWLKTLRLI